MKRIIFTFIIILNISAAFAQKVGNQDDSTVLVEVDSWLKIIDEKDYEKSWDQSSKLFQRAVTKEQWVNAVAIAREPFGNLITRDIKTKKYNTELPGMPDGHYYSFEFSSSFEKKKQSIETITALLENEKWKVIGYFIR